MSTSEATEHLGPISYLIVQFPGAKLTGEGLAELVQLVERGLIRILDLRFVLRESDGSIAALEIADLDGDGTLDLAIFEGASSGMMDESDFADAQEAIVPGAAAAILIFENTWAAPFVRGLRNSNAELVAAGYIPHDVITASLDATDG